MTKQFQNFKAVKYFSCLHGLRFLCIAAVLWHHGSSLVGVSLEGYPRFVRSGFLGVDMFFVLSGFLITTLLLREEEKNGTFLIHRFYFRRILRIIPVYYFVVISVSVYYILIKEETSYIPLVPIYLGFLSNFLDQHIPTLGITWSLAVEEQYYMLWPAILMFVPRRYIVHALVGMILLNLAIVMGFFSAVLGLMPVTAGPLTFRLPNATYTPILLGSLIAFLMHRKNCFTIFYRILGSHYSPIIMFSVMLLVILLTPDNLKGLPNMLVHLSMGAFLISLVIREDNCFQQFMTLKPISRIGEISYGIYLYHLIALHLTNMLIARSEIGLGIHWLVCYGLISFIIAEISFQTLESYFLNLKKSVNHRSKATQTTGTN